LFRIRDSARLFEVTTEAKKTLLQQLLGSFGSAVSKAIDFISAR
jgi:hypothetical protein